MNLHEGEGEDEGQPADGMGSFLTLQGGKRRSYFDFQNLKLVELQPEL